jgi:hypothetical protein
MKIIIIVALSCFAWNAHTRTHIQPDTFPFPQHWEGNWEGQLNIYNAKGVAQSVTMRLEIHALDSTGTYYTYGMMYGSKDKDWRPYELRLVDKAKGLWQMDEKNSIVIETYQRGPQLISNFSVQGSQIISLQELTLSGEMIFEIIASKDQPVSTTGNTKQGEEEIPEVKTFPIGVFQRAVLKKVQ